MPSPAETRRAVEEVVGTKGDDAVFEYVVSILEDGEFDFGTDGEEAFEAFGAVLVMFCSTYRRQVLFNDVLVYAILWRKLWKKPQRRHCVFSEHEQLHTLHMHGSLPVCRQQHVKE